MAVDRRWKLLANIQADTAEDLADHLRDLAHRIEHEGYAPTSSISGGPSSSHILRITENPDMNHDAYFAALDAELDGRCEPLPVRND